MKRTLFFIKDTVDGKFYTGQNNDLADFSGAAVYYSEDSAKKKIKQITNAWLHDQEWADHWLKEKSTDKKWAKEVKNGVIKREKLDKWGMEIVSVEVKAP